MKRNVQHMTGQQAWELSKWCSETAELIRGHCQISDQAARQWWEAECNKPSEIEISPRRYECMWEFADRLQAESYEWAGEAGGLYAEEDGYGAEPD